MVAASFTAPRLFVLETLFIGAVKIQQTARCFAAAPKKKMLEIARLMSTIYLSVEVINFYKNYVRW